ncbi:MAG: carbonic anhydrase [Cyanophyceae cyanobacterium]
MKKLIKGLRKFQSDYYCSHQGFFEQLAQGQSPRALFIRCSDSRADPELITQAQPGEIFVIRNAGNIIPSYGAANGGEGATVEYAIEALGVQDIVVCGHSHCGAMKGLLKVKEIEEKLPLVSRWLDHAEATRRVVMNNYSACTFDDLIEIAVAENVLTQVDHLRTYPVVRDKLNRGELQLHGWVYEIESGKVYAYDPTIHEYVEPDAVAPTPTPSYVLSNYHSKSCTWLPAEQGDRIYRGSGY